MAIFHFFLTFYRFYKISISCSSLLYPANPTFAKFTFPMASIFPLHTSSADMSMLYTGADSKMLTSQQTSYNMRMIAVYCCRSNSNHTPTGAEHTPVKTGRFYKSLSQQNQIAANEPIFQEVDVFLRNLNKQRIAFESQSNQDNITQPQFRVQLTETSCLEPNCFP